jgi:membrane fusion protein (multidrug efflux system)
MFAKARIVLREKPQAVVIPEEAILPAGSEAFVYRVENGRAMRTRVETGIRREGKVEIVSGVSPGELVVTAGQLRLQRDGMEVRVVEATPRAPAGGTPAAGPGRSGAGG